MAQDSPFRRLADSAVITVSAGDMLTITRELTISDSSVEGSIEGIPVGKARLFSLTVYDSLGNVHYRGTAEADISEGSTARIILNVIRVSEDTEITGEIIETGTVTDADGNVYQTVKIGNQEWMAENLRTTKYNDGSPIPNLISDTAWDSCQYTQTGAYCYYNNTTDSDSIEKFGALYNWYALNTGKLAPAGWHVSTEAEWTMLADWLIANGYTYDGTTTGNDIAKSMAAKTDWAASEVEGAIGNDLSTNNRSGFSALPGGYRNYDSKFYSQGYVGFWWTAPEYDASNAWTPYLHHAIENLRRYYFGKSAGCSVRLLRD
jgi:uncharacterized protein (TIGR02145 family)